MKTGGSGGGTTITGLNFEKKVDFRELITAIPGYELKKVTHKAGLGVFFEKSLLLAVSENTIFTGFWKRSVLTGNTLFQRNYYQMTPFWLL